MTTRSKEKQKTVTDYHRDELIAAARDVFGVEPEIVAGALHDKTRATKQETEQAIQDFLTKSKEEKGAND